MLMCSTDGLCICSKSLVHETYSTCPVQLMGARALRLICACLEAICSAFLDVRQLGSSYCSDWAARNPGTMARSFKLSPGKISR